MQAALWCYAWDLADDPKRFMSWAADSGITQLNLAATYHAGWFLHPASERAKAFMPEDGAHYFWPQMELYQGMRLKPQVAQVCTTTDWFGVTSATAGDYGLDLVAWTIGTHNTRLGTLHPQCAVENCFGDSYPHALCPAHPEVRAYLEAVCLDLSTNYRLKAIQLESFGYLGWRHGHHHERDLTGLSAEESRLMDLCFHEDTCRVAAAAGLDVVRLRQGVRETLLAAMEHAPERPRGYPRLWEEICARLPELEAYCKVCTEVETSIIAAVSSVLTNGTHLHLGAYHDAHAAYGEHFATSVYGQDPRQAAQTVSRARAKMPDFIPLSVGLRLGCGVPASLEELQELLRAISDAGADMVIFYNASEAPPSMLRWIKPALEALR